MPRRSRLAAAILASLPLSASLAAPAALLTAAPAAAQREAGAAAGPRLMIVDSQRILREAQAVTALQTTIEAEREAFRDQLRQREAELRQEDAALTRERPTLSNEEYLQRRRDLEQRFAGYQSEIAERRRALEGRFTTGMRLVESRLLEIVGDLAEERDVDLVLSKSAVLLADPGYEATEEVLRRLDGALPQVTVPEE